MANTFNNSIIKSIGTSTLTEVYSGSNLDASGDVGIVVGMLYSNTGASDTQITTYHTAEGVSVTPSSDSGLKFTASNTFTAGDAVVFSTTGSLPGNISANTIYYVIAGGLTSSVFYVSTTSGGSAVAHSSNGSNTSVHLLVPFLNTVSIPKNTALELCRGNKFVMKKGESLNAVRTGGASATATISVLEITS